MKKWLAWAAAVMTVACSFVFGASFISKHVYADTVYVYYIADDHSAVLKYWNDDEYYIKDAEDLEVGDVCSLVMYDRMTDRVWDDVAIRCTYAGFNIN